MSSGAVLDLNGYTLFNPLTISGTGISSSGAIINSSATAATQSGAIILAADSILGGTGALNVSGSITSNNFGLVLLGSGAKTLNSNSNTLSTIATGSSVGALSLVNSSSLTVSSITLGGTTYSGLNSSGTISLATIAGDLTVASNISTTNSSSSAIVLVAGSSTAAANATGGNIIWLLRGTNTKMPYTWVFTPL